MRPFPLEPCDLWFWETGLSPWQFPLLIFSSHLSLSISVSVCFSVCLSFPCLCLFLSVSASLCLSLFLSVSIPISPSVSFFLSLQLAGVSGMCWAGFYLLTHPFPACPSYIHRLSYGRLWQETGRWEEWRPGYFSPFVSALDGVSSKGWISCWVTLTVISVSAGRL